MWNRLILWNTQWRERNQGTKISQYILKATEESFGLPHLVSQNIHLVPILVSKNINNSSYSSFFLLLHAVTVRTWRCPCLKTVFDLLTSELSYMDTYTHVYIPHTFTSLTSKVLMSSTSPFSYVEINVIYFLIHAFNCCFVKFHVFYILIFPGLAWVHQILFA